VAEDKKRLASTSMEENAQEVEAFYSHAKGDGLKAFVTVMQGCDNFCSYCIVPHVRGREISRPSADIVEEIKRLAEGGIREVTLLGQNVNSYGLKGGDGADFTALVRRVAAIEGILRIRFTTSHPKDLSDELIALFAEEEKLMPHLHLPVQSGSDEILEAMNRGYDTAHYLGLVEKIRRVAPKIALTSDMIVGFPGETDEDFAATLKIMEEVQFDNLFSFKYSPRSHTAAQKLSGQVAEKVKDQRLAELQTLQKEHTLSRNRQWLGEVRPVMCEGPSKAGKGQLMGRTPENKIVNFTRPEAGPGEVVNLTVVEAYVNSLIGRPPELEDQCS
jgi:tRNA-2-methylthio-N6-dimethylallyladenosine synthase